jgi:hypothetical protein
MPAGVSSAAVSEAGDVPHEDLVRTKRMPFGQRVGGWVIHFPAVVCTNSPSTPWSLVRQGAPQAQHV